MMRPLAATLTGLFLFTINSLSFPVLSEFMASNETTLPDEDGDFSDWIEIANMGNTAIDLAGYHLTDNEEELTRWTFPSINVAAGARLVVFASGKDRTNPAAELHTDFQLDAGGEYLALVAPDGITVITEFAPFYPPQNEDQSYGLSSFTGGVSETFVGENAAGKYFIPVDGSLGNDWHQAQFDDSSWQTGTAGFGWETPGAALDSLISTDIRDDMRNRNASGFFRFEFNFESTDREIQGLTLNTRIDDGYVAYLNGTRVAEYNAPENESWNSRSNRPGRSDAQIVASASEHNITGFSQLVTNGLNVLAIHGMNSSPGGSDFMVKAELIAAIQDRGTKLTGFFNTPSPGNPNSAGNGAGPIFVEYTEKPDRPNPGAGLAVAAQIVGVNSPVTEVRLIYRVMFGNESTIPMTENPPGSGNFTARIPADFFAGDMIRWRFEATDEMGFETLEPPFPSATDSHQYVGTVANNPDVETKLPVVELFLQNPSAAGTTTGTRGAVFYLGELYDNVRLDRHGQSTGGFIKKSFNIDFNKTQRFRWNPDEKRVKDIDLLTNWADKSKVRHVFSYEIMRNSGVHAHFAYTVRVQQNGDFFSTADFVEDADDIYLDRAGLNPDGALYKIYNNQLNSTSNTGGVEKKNRREENNADLQGLVNGLNNNSGNALWNYIYDNVNIPMCINMCAANCVIRNTDMHRKNWYLYRDTGRSDEWAILPWDLDLAHGRKWNGSDTYFDNNLFSTGVIQVGTSVKLVSLLWSNPETREMLMRRIRTLSDQFLQPPGTPYAERYLERRLDEQAALIDPPEFSPSDARADFMKWGSWIQSNGSSVDYTSSHPDVEDMAEGIARWKNEYLPGRRAYIYGASAGLPEPQSGQLSFVFTPLLTSGATAKTKVPEDGSDGTAWTLPGFDDSLWTQGTTGIGFDSVKYVPLIGTDTKAAMRNLQATSYSRIEFEATNPSAYQALQLHMKFDDGFIAYINGTRVHQMHSPASPSWNSAATTTSQEADINEFEIFDISHHLDTLVEGTNVLAIHGMNGSTGSSDFLILPELYAGIADSEGSNEPLIKFGEIDFNPVSHNQDEEFVELINDNSIAVDVSNWTVSGGIEMEIPPGTVIPAGGSLYLSPDRRAFRARLTSPRGDQSRFVVGPYSGHLSNLGETLNLHDSAGLKNNAASYAGDPSDTQLYLVVSELHYHPSNNGLAEFIELMNISSEETLDLSGVRFTDGIDFDFTSASITSLAPGERVLVVRDVNAFELEFGSELPVAGTFNAGGALGNGGESIKLEDAENGTIRQFRYNDKSPWPTSADGGGNSLVLIDPESVPDHQLPASWTASLPSPGSSGSGFPENPEADIDGDGLNAFLEYALGTDDHSADSSNNPISFAFLEDATAFSYRRNMAAGDLVFTVETSNDLENWIDASSLDLVEISRVENGDGSESVTVRLPEEVSTRSFRAFRLRVSR